MKLGKRRKDDDPKDEPTAAANADVAGGAVTETWTAPVAERTSSYAPSADDNDDAAAASESPVDSQAAAASEPPVDSDAVELPPVPAAPEPVVPDPRTASVPLTTPDPPARSYAAAASSRVAMPPPVAHDPAIAMGGATPADGHAPADPLMDEIRVLAAERPEIVVGAAFAGGLVAAMILRRLGN